MVWLTNKSCLALYPARTVVIDLTIWTSTYRLCCMKLCSSDNHYPGHILEIYGSIQYWPERSFFWKKGLKVFELSLKTSSHGTPLKWYRGLPSLHENSHKLCNETRHPILSLTESWWKLIQQRSEFPNGAKAILEQVLASE